VTLALIGAANLLLAVAIWRHGAGAAAAEPTDARETTADAVALGVPAWILGLACLSGLVSLAFEVTLFRALFVLNPSSPYNVPAVLVPSLLAIAVGSAVFTRFRGDDRAEALRRVGLLFVAAAGAMLLAVAVSGGLSLRSYRGVGLSPAAGAVVVHATLLAASLPLFLGAVLPLLMRVVAATGRELPARAGWLYLANALGAFTGALLTQSSWASRRWAPAACRWRSLSSPSGRAASACGGLARAGGRRRSSRPWRSVRGWYRTRSGARTPGG
jgi:hypothetical protein